jgi:glutamate-ammonia-ligase adenylyltransferase
VGALCLAEEPRRRAARRGGRAGARWPLRSLVTAFVYRRYLDYGVFEGLRQLHRKIREEAQRRAAGRPERANDVKLSRGGIREIEFIVQLMLVVRGGQFPEIRTRSTLRGLQRLAERGLMKPETAERGWPPAYTFLRRVEHRIQYLDDQQTHLLPSGDEDLRWIAQPGPGLRTRSLRAADPAWARCASWWRPSSTRCCTTARLARPTARARLQGCGTGPLPVDSEALLERLPPVLATRLRGWVQQPRVQACATRAGCAWAA